MDGIRGTNGGRLLLETGFENQNLNFPGRGSTREGGVLMFLSSVCAMSMGTVAGVALRHAWNPASDVLIGFVFLDVKQRLGVVGSCGRTPCFQPLIA